MRRVALAKADFNPAEPRLPKGDPHGGEWTTGGGASSATVDGPTYELADLSNDESNDSGTSPGVGITWQWNPPAAPSTMDSPDLTSDGSGAKEGDGSDGENGDGPPPRGGDAIYPDYTFENLLLLLGTGGAGTASRLARALIRLGIRRAAASDTHHIVAQHARRAEPAQEVLKRFGIDVDDPANGVFMPEVQHDHLHTNAYYDAVNEALLQATTRAEAEAILRSIARRLEAGTFP